MAQTNVGKTTITDMDNGVSNYSVAGDTIDDAETQEFTYDSPRWTEYLGYYRKHPELKGVVTALAVWTVGQGWTVKSSRNNSILKKIIGWGEDSFQSIIENAMVVMKINGDSYTEIIRNDSGALINLKPLNPSKTRHIVNRKGVITRYEEIRGDKVLRKLNPEQVLHLCNDRIASEIHGQSIVESVKWIIDARHEAMNDWRKMLHRNLFGVRVIEVDEDSTSKLATLKEQWKEAINKGEVLILPKGTATFPQTNVQNPESWIQYLENYYYQAVGVPRVIATSENFTEAASKVGFLTFEPVYTREQTLLEADILNQLGIELKFNRPVSLGSQVQEDEAKNTGQTNIQPNETQVGLSRTE